MATIKIPPELSPECKKCKGKMQEWDAPNLPIDGPLVVPFRIHVEKYNLDSTKFKLIDYKSTPINGTCSKCNTPESANLLFDDEGRSFGIFTDTVQDRYLFQHSSEISDREEYMKKLLSLEFVDGE